MSSPVFFLGTPLHDARVHQAYLAGAMELSAALPQQLILSEVTRPFLPVSRDVLTAQFLRSPATHFLCVDSDIGFRAADVQRLLVAQKDFVSGIYATKDAERRLTSPLSRRREGDLIEVNYAAAGFLLLTRACVERMVQAHPELEYHTPDGRLWALWSPIFDVRPYGEDASFSKRWRALGGQIWAHSGVVLEHHGDIAFLPKNLAGPRT